jgi:general secretion pathway protein G
MKNHENRRPTLCSIQAGFTLIELLLVLVILGVLASIVYPNMKDHGTKARITAAKTQIDAFRTALGTFEVENGYFPKGKDGLQALVERPSDAPNWNGPYMDSIPKDPWGHDYLYECPGKHNPASYDITSMGPDATAGTADDVANRLPKK